jgi:hypothetical protein
VPRAAHALDPGGDRARRADEAGQVHRAHVDAQLQRGGGHDDLELASLEALLGLEPPRARQAAVVGGDGLDAQALAQVHGQPLDQAAGVHEHDGGSVRARQRGQAVVDLRPLLVGAHRPQLVLQHLDAQVQVAAAAGVDHRRGEAVAAHQQAAGHLHGAHGGREPDPLQAPAGEVIEPLQREGQVRAALVGGQGVDLVDDHRTHVAQAAAARLGGEQDEERLGGGDQDVGRLADRVPPLLHCGVAGAHGRTQRQGEVAVFLGGGEDLRQRVLEVALDVVGQRLQRGDVEDVGVVLELAGYGLAGELIEAPEEGRERLARAGGRREQDVLARGDGRPRPALHRRGVAKRRRNQVSMTGWNIRSGRYFSRSDGLPRASDVKGAQRAGSGGSATLMTLRISACNA